MKSTPEPMVGDRVGRATSPDNSATPKRRILFVDNDAESRKERIAVLRQHGFMVYPALDLQQAATRCRCGAYDLIVVNGTGNFEDACAVCDQILKGDPQQCLLLMTLDANVSDRDYAVSSAPEELLQRVESLFPKAVAPRPVAA